MVQSRRDEKRRWEAVLGLGGLVLLAAVIRGWASSHVPIVSEDAAGGYLYQARELLQANWRLGIGTYFPPGLPALIAGLACLGLDLQAAGKVLSVATGSVLVVLTYKYARDFYGGWEGWTAAFLTATYPALIIASADVVSEGTYTILLALACWSSAAAFRQGGEKIWFGIGVVFALMYLIRGEALVFLALVTLLCAVRSATAMAKGPHAIRRARIMLVPVYLLTGFSALAFPYVAFLKMETGSWQVSGKTIENLIAYDIDEAGSPVDYERARMSIAPDGRHLRIDLERKQSAFEFLWKHRSRQLRKYVQNLSQAYIQELPRVIPPIFLALLAIGLYISMSSTSDVLREAYFLLWFMIPFFFYPVFLVEARYFLPVVPLAILWISRGAVALFRGPLRVLQEHRMARRCSSAWVFSGMLLALSLCHQAPVIMLLRADPGAFPLEHRAAGEWLKDHGRQHPRVMNRKSFVSFYSEGIPYVTPYADTDAIIRYARAQEVDYIVVDDRYTIPVRPQLGVLLEETSCPAGIRKVYQDNSKKGARIAVFELLPEAGGRSVVEQKRETLETR